MKKIVVAFGVGCLLVACVKPASTSSASSAAIVRPPPLPVSPEEQLCRNVCTRCHYFEPPNRHSASEWPAVVDEMQHKKRETNFTDEEKIKILKYLVANAR